MTKTSAFFLVCFILYGCGTSEIAVRKFELNRAAISDTIAAETVKIKRESKSENGRASGNGFNEKDSSTIYKATLYRNGSTEQKSNEVAAIAEFNPETKKFFLEVPAIKDTIIIHDTLKLKPTDLIIRGNTLTEKIIWIISFILTSIIIMSYKRYSNVRASSK